MSIKLLATLLILVLQPKSPEGHWLPHWPSGPNPLCSNQFALVNRACLLLPGIKPGLPSLPPREGGEALSVSHGHHHRRHHGHRLGHGHHELGQGGMESPAEEECCRWLKEVDSMCACDLLVHLPPFLVKPIHSYTVVVDDACSVTFHCPPRK